MVEVRECIMEEMWSLWIRVEVTAWFVPQKMLLETLYPGLVVAEANLCYLAFLCHSRHPVGLALTEIGNYYAWAFHLPSQATLESKTSLLRTYFFGRAWELDQEQVRLEAAVEVEDFLVLEFDNLCYVHLQECYFHSME